MSLTPVDTSSNYDALFAGDYPKVTDSMTIASGGSANYVRGTVLGKITSGGKGTIVNSGSGDGSQAPYAVLAVDVDARSADVVAPIYKSGEFNENKLVFGGSDTADTHRAALRDANIYMRKAVPA